VTSYLIEVTIHTKAEHKNQMQIHPPLYDVLIKKKRQNNTTPKISGRPVVRSFQEVDQAISHHPGRLVDLLVVLVVL
jgi:hypothetical protein